MVDDNRNTDLNRCGWCSQDPLYQAYHDEVWGRPVADGQSLFAKLCLDGQQAGLSWITILRKQSGYEAAFAGFDPDALIHFTEADVERLMGDPGIVRNRLKIQSVIRNARAYVAMRDAGEDFSRFLWGFVGGKPLINSRSELAQIPTETDESRSMSKALKQRGFNFVGPTICYAFMQATGLVMDHLTSCHSYRECQREAESFQLSGQ
ncbi:MAG TPA: DNA-3-methyladenine glycosylase I [Saccharospirillum sp.]|nr:DNA-3-methyladenine glycosylase I [Saccharospirillum sp.]